MSVADRRLIGNFGLGLRTLDLRIRVRPLVGEVILRLLFVVLPVVVRESIGSFVTGVGRLVLLLRVVVRVVRVFCI